MRRNNIYELRKAKGIRRPDLAKQLGVCYNTVAKWEYNSIFPALEFVEPLCEILECAEEDLFPFHKEYFKYGLDRLIKGYHVLLSREGISAPRTPSKSIRSRILYINHGCEVFRVSLKGLADAADNMDLIVPDMAKIQAFVIKNWKGTQVELADELDATEGTVSRWYCGNRTMSKKWIPCVCELFDLTPDELIERSLKCT